MPHRKRAAASNRESEQPPTTNKTQKEKFLLGKQKQNQQKQLTFQAAQATEEPKEPCEPRLLFISGSLKQLTRTYSWTTIHSSTRCLSFLFAGRRLVVSGNRQLVRARLTKQRNRQKSFWRKFQQIDWRCSPFHSHFLQSGG